jgi:uncharacterized membrane protein YsdA (DUF1294 family)
MNYFVSLLIIWNIVTILIYGIDKMLAKAHKRRISEQTLLICAFLMGGCGAIFGMVLFNHKTSKMKFRILVPLAILIGIIVVYWSSTQIR